MLPVLWLHYDHTIESFHGPASKRTHMDVWGSNALHFWRGSIDKKTNEVSILVPLGFSGQLIPEWLLEKLKAEFGEDLKIEKPKTPGVRIK